MIHTFIVNTENVNEYGYRVLTDGIDTTQYERNPVVLFYHERINNRDRGSEVIGRSVKLRKEDGKLMADVEFDLEDEFSKKIAGKVERGFIRMASMYADVIATSMDAEDILPGQCWETVTKCKLVEISIVDIGGNDDALKLSKAAGDQLKLKKLNLNQELMNLKTIALALGRDANTSEDDVLGTITKLKSDKETADSKVVQLQGELKAIKSDEAKAIVGECIALGLLPAALEATQLQAFDNDFDGQKAVLSKLIADKKADNGLDETHNKIKEVVLGGKGANGASPEIETFDFLQKHNVVKLQKMKEENPTQYEKLHQDYKNGARHK